MIRSDVINSWVSAKREAWAQVVGPYSHLSECSHRTEPHGATARREGGEGISLLRVHVEVYRKWTFLRCYVAFMSVVNVD